MMFDPAEDMESLRARLERTRKAFAAALRDYESAGGRYIDRASYLPQEAVADCRFFRDRLELLEHLPRHGIVAEVGTDKGDFAAKILSVAEPVELHIFERDVGRISPDNLQAHIASGRCIVHAGDSSELLKTMPAKSFDWIYIDADHSYEGVKRDIEASVPRLKDEGMLVFNDYTVWSISSMRRCGVAKAVNEFVRQEGWRLVCFAFQTTMYCDVAIRRP